jgi:hypothetical protein
VLQSLLKIKSLPRTLKCSPVMLQNSLAGGVTKKPTAMHLNLPVVLQRSLLRQHLKV